MATRYQDTRMAARPGEELVANVFADVHYFLGPPNTKPLHHRFDKGSYVYIFEHAGERRARLEIANNAGTPEQDAFNGSLSKSHVHYSYKHSNLITLTVDFIPGQSPNSSEWRLPSFDERNENKYLYKLHTIDFYFWTQEDALLFLSSVRRVLPYSQVTVVDEPMPAAAHQSAMSPIVQNLEKVAITDPSYQHGQTRDSKGLLSFPGPPSAPAPTQQSPASFAPMAYNPAAPAAPEAIAHREKTPPPEDGVANPLAAVAASDHGVPQYQNPQAMRQQQASYFPGPPQSAGLQSPYHQALPSAGLQSPYGSTQMQHPMSFPPPPPPQPTGSAGSQQPYAQQVPLGQNPSAPPPQYSNYPGSPGLSSPMQSTPPGGYSSYSYTQQQQPLQVNQAQQIHQQVYRPTEFESVSKFHGPAPPKKDQKGKLEDKADKAEKKVSGFLKKMEKKYL